MYGVECYIASHLNKIYQDKPALHKIENHHQNFTWYISIESDRLCM